MKTMSDYTIYCTEEQTKKAYNLGAPLEVGDGKGAVSCRKKNSNTYMNCKFPTAEQMIGWLEEQKNINEIFVSLGSSHWHCTIIQSDETIIGSDNSYNSRKEATLAAIDAALNYLTDIKKQIK